MAEWKQCKLSEIADIIMGQSPKSDYYNTEGKGIPFLQGNRTFGMKYPFFDTWTTKVTKEAQAGDVIMSVRAPVGALNITTENVCLGRGVCGLRMKNGRQDFLFYLMKFSMPQLLNKETGTIFGSVNRNDISNLTVLVPEDNVQDMVSHILKNIDDKIENNNKINRNLQEQCFTIFHGMFDEIMSTSDLMEFGNIASFKYGTMPKKDKISDSGYVVFSGYKSVGYYPEKMFDEPQLIIVARGVGGTGDVKYTPADCYLTNLAIAIMVENKVYEEYIYHYLMCQDMKILNTGSAQPQITVSSLEKYKICVPNEMLAKEFSDIVIPIRDQIRRNRFENDKLEKIRDCLLPKLMLGEIDVLDLDI